MTYAFVTDVPAPIELYVALHTEILRRTVGDPEGLLVHLGRETAAGFQIIEIWETKELCERYDAEVVGPVVAHLTDGQAPPREPERVEFEPRGLVLPAAHVAV
jgi:hypothetical protein